MARSSTGKTSAGRPGPQAVPGKQLAAVPIPRGARARERLLRAALDVLAERGLPGLTMEAIAQRAAASKATVYRHWRSPGQVLVDAMDLSFQPFALPEGGQLRTDLIELLSRFEALVAEQTFPRLMAAFIDAAERDPALKSLHVQLTERRREPARYVLDQARQRGEIPAHADIELAVDLLSGPAFYRRFIAHRAFPRGYASAVVDHVLAALLFTGEPRPLDPASGVGDRRRPPRPAGG